MKKKIEEILQKLGFSAKVKEGGQLSLTEWTNVCSSYRDAYNTELNDDIAQFQASQQESQETFNNQLLSILNSAEGTTVAPVVSAATATPNNNDVTKQILDSLNTIVINYNTLAKQMIPDTAPVVGQNVNTGAHTNQYVFGIENDFYSTSKRWNKITVNSNLSPLSNGDAKSVTNSFFNELANYSTSLANRVNDVIRNPALMSLTPGINTGDTSSYVDQFVTRRQDAIIAHISKAKNVYEVFPRRFGVQDREILTNAFFGSFSQGYQTGKVFKGSVELAPEIAWVDDAMFKAQFSSYKELERNYLGYLNKEGSDPMKWSFIEWVLVQIADVLMLEQAKRKIWGCYTKPEKDKPGHFMQSGNGVLATLVRYYHENKILPFFTEYTTNGEVSGAAMVDLINEMYNKITNVVDDINGYQILLNANHRKIYHDYIREYHGRETDFKPQNETFFDTDVAIKWVPYMFDLPMIIFQKPGNLQCVENIAGEMLATSFDTEMESVIFWSTWKEGFSAYFAGKEFKTREELVIDDMKSQDIFFNLPSQIIDVDATEVVAVKNRFYYLTSDNSATKGLTDITGAAKGSFYVIEASKYSNPQTISKAGKFANITKAYTPTKEGDYIKVMLNCDGDGFIELERRVGGVHEINKLIQPNIVR